MRYGCKRLLCALLAAVMLFAAFSFFVPARKVEALDYSAIKSGLNTWQYYFSRTAMSIALKDFYDSGVLPSITVGQIAVEGGFSDYPISVIGKNFYGMKAYPSLWSGKIYDDKEYVIYNSYNDLVNIKGEEYAKKASIWRAYDAWEEGIFGHTHLFFEESKYIPVRTATNYGEAALAIQNSGYAGNTDTYAGNLIKKIEMYGFDQLDFVEADEHGIFGLLMSQAEAYLEPEDTLELQAVAYPETEYDYAPETVWESDNPEVATVDEHGVVTAIAPGYTLITADFGEKEACCVVCVHCNAWTMKQTNGVYTVWFEPDSDSDSMGKIYPGQPIHINSETVYDSEDGNTYYAVTLRNAGGNVVSGYVNTRYVYRGGDARLSIGTPLSILHLETEQPYQIPVEIYAEELKEKVITFESSDETVLTVDNEGNVTTLAEGVALVNICLDGEKALTVTVYVGTSVYEEIIATAAVYIRDGCDSNYKVLGTIRKGQTVKLLNNLGDGWYRVLAVLDGNFVIGYSYSKYFRFPWEEVSEPDDSSVTESSSESSESSEFSDPASSETPSDPVSESSESSEPSEPSEPSQETSHGTVIVTYKTGKVSVETSLNVRKTPSTSGAKLVTIPDRTAVTILEEIRVESEAKYKDWYKVSFTFNRKDYEGYVAADFILLTGTKEVEIPDEPIASDRYTVDDFWVRGILPGTTADAFAEELGRKVVVKTADGTVVSGSSPIATGQTVDFYIGTILVYTRTAVVRSDVNGDGITDAFDYMLVKAGVLGTLELEDAFLQAACLVDGSTLSALDYMLIKCVVLGTYDLASD
ncbi:MAG: SH3 domain-containing protein [Clostridiales bacterium]|nr:SH3 domain-containing protein [Candidatus Coliplasma caballi]